MKKIFGGKMQSFLYKKSKLIGYVVLILILITGQNTFAQTTYTSQSSGAWTTAVWAPAGTPGASDSVVIQSGDVIDLSTGAQSIDGVLIQSGGELNCTANLLTINGDLDINSGGTWTNGGDCEMGGTNAQDINFSGSGLFGNLTINNSGTGTGDDVSLSSNIIVLGNFTIQDGEFLPQTNTVRLGGNFSKTGGELTPGQSEFWFSEDVAYTVTTNADISFYDITHNPSGLLGSKSLTFSSAFTYEVQNEFTRGGESASISNSGGTATIAYTNNTGTLIYLSTNTMTVSDEWPTGNTNNPDNVELSTNSTITSSSGSRETDNLNIDGGGTFSITGSGTLTINTQLTLTNGTFSSGASGFAYGSGATLRYANSSSGQTVGNEWTASDAPTNLVVANSSGASPALNLGSGTPSRSLSGNFTLSNGLVDFNATGQTLTVGNDVYGGSGRFGTASNNTTLSVTGGSSAVTASDATTIYNLTMNTATGSLNNITISNNLIIPTGNAVTLGGAITMSSGSNLNINGTGSLDLAGFSLNASGSTITVNGTIDLNGGALSGNPTVNLNGDLQTGGSGLSGPTWNLGGSSTIEYDGGSQESIASDFAFDNLTINNSSGVTVGSNDPTVDGTLTLTNGNLITTSGSITVDAVSGGSANSYIDGPVDVQTASTSEVVLSLGENGTWRRIGITPSAAGSTTYRAEFNDSDPQNGGTRTTLGTGVTVVSTISHWTVSRQSGSANAQIRLYWESTSDGVGNPNTLLAVHWTGSEWAHSGGTGDTGTGNTTSGNVVSAQAFSSFGDFALGSSATDNSLPVTLTSFTANADFGRINLNWKTESEIDNQGFNIYRANETNPENWITVNQELIPGAGNTSAKTEYSFVDQTVQAGETYYYRLESISYNGVRELFIESTVTITAQMPNEFALLDNYPNPFNPVTNIKFQVPEASEVSMIVYDVQGHLVKKLLSNSTFEPGEHSVQWDATDNYNNSVSTGVYFYQFVSGNFQKIGKMMLIK